MKLKDLNDQLMAIAAHRYCLGRRSYTETAFNGLVKDDQDWVRSSVAHKHKDFPLFQEGGV